MAMHSPRRTRSRTKAAARDQSSEDRPEAAEATTEDELKPTLTVPERKIAGGYMEISTGTRLPTLLPAVLTPALTKLTRKDHGLLMLKQERLQESSAAAYLFDVVPKSWSKNPTAQFAVDATLVFGQEEAGTAVCISPDGLLLTCSHCVAEDEQQLDSDWRSGKLHWLLFRSGTAVCAECLAWDPKRDLALMRVVQAQTARRVPLPSSSPSLTSSAPQPPTSSPSAPLIETVSSLNPYPFPFAVIAAESPPVGSRVVCIGHPGSQDLEASRPGVQTNYDVLHTSTGRYRGLAAGQDPQDNSEIGALMHDAWTYWGHSGAPLLAWGSGALVGLHSSWDDQTGMRRGVPLVAIREFIEENKRHFSWWPLSG